MSVVKTMNIKIVNAVHKIKNFWSDFTGVGSVRMINIRGKGKTTSMDITTYYQRGPYMSFSIPLETGDKFRIIFEGPKG